MKSVTILLSLLILSLSLKPCSDGTNIEDNHSEEISVNHNHQDDSDDSCPITCFCNCCGMTITYVPIPSPILELNTEISTLIYSNYKSNYRFDILSTIWNPPRFIS